jgi:hypothetical protein
MSSNLLRDTGEALYGPRWQSELARDLNVADRTMRRWTAKTDDLPQGVALDLLRLCDKRAQTLNEIRVRLHEADLVNAPRKFGA